MDVFLYHGELQGNALPDCCVRCGQGDTELVVTVLSDTAVTEYTRVALPFCRRHEKASLLSFGYVGLREFTAEGVVVKNVCEPFVRALEEFRERHPPDRSVTVELDPRKTTTPEAERAIRRLVVGLLVAAVLGGLAIGVLVAVLNRPENPAAPANPAVREPGEHDLPGPDPLGPRHIPGQRRPIFEGRD